MLRAPAQIISTAFRPAANALPYNPLPPRSSSTIHRHLFLLPQHNTAYTIYHSTHTRSDNIQHTMVKRKADTLDELLELEKDDTGPVQVPPYDVTKESSAKSVVTSDEYNKLTKGIKHVARRITEPLKKSEYCDASSVVKVVNLTEQRLTENVPETIMVTIGGNMGSGMHFLRKEEKNILTPQRKKQHDQLHL